MKHARPFELVHTHNNMPATWLCPVGSDASTSRLRASPETSFLQLPWEHLLSHLFPASLGQLACTCKHLCAVVDDADPSVWQHAAIQILGPEHPVVAACSTPGCPTVPSVRTALQRHAEAIHNMSRGRFDGEAIVTQLSKCDFKWARIF